MYNPPITPSTPINKSPTPNPVVKKLLLYSQIISLYKIHLSYLHMKPGVAHERSLMVITLKLFP